MPDPARLYLITPILQMPEPFAAALTAALDAAPVDCVLLRTPPADDKARRLVAAALTPLVQARGTALLVADDTRAAGAADADGVHVGGVGPEFEAALRSMKPHRIVGVGGLATRDEAMLAGEAGVDYLLFGDEIDGAVPPLEDRLERVGWWAEIFQVPCVAWAHELDEVAPLARAGAEFVALGDAVWSDPRGPAAALGAAAALLADVAAREAVGSETA